MSDDTQPVITVTPNNPVQGQKINISYSGTLPVTLELDWDPAGTPTSVTITRATGAVVTVPSNASSLVVTDPTGGADWVGIVISP